VLDEPLGLPTPELEESPEPELDGDELELLPEGLELEPLLDGLALEPLLEGLGLPDGLALELEPLLEGELIEPLPELDPLEEPGDVELDPLLPDGEDDEPDDAPLLLSPGPPALSQPYRPPTARAIGRMTTPTFLLNLIWAPQIMVRDETLNEQQGSGPWSTQPFAYIKSGFSDIWKGSK
jgi:hypothetical protein